MNWIEKIRSKPQEQKIRLIWITIIVAAVVLLVLWIILSRFSRSLPKDTTLFDTFGKGVKDLQDNYKK